MQSRTANVTDTLIVTLTPKHVVIGRKDGNILSISHAEWNSLCGIVQKMVDDELTASRSFEQGDRLR